MKITFPSPIVCPPLLCTSEFIHEACLPLLTSAALFLSPAHAAQHTCLIFLPVNSSICQGLSHVNFSVKSSAPPFSLKYLNLMTPCVCVTQAPLTAFLLSWLPVPISLLQCEPCKAELYPSRPCSSPARTGAQLTPGLSPTALKWTHKIFMVFNLGFLKVFILEGALKWLGIYSRGSLSKS